MVSDALCFLHSGPHCGAGRDKNWVDMDVLFVVEMHFEASAMHGTAGVNEGSR